MEILLIICFAIGYLFIVLENSIKLDKAVPAILTGIVCWVVFASFQPDQDIVYHKLMEHVGEIASILFFLMCAMAIVELIDLHDGFNVITDLISTTSKSKLLIIVTLIAFFLSSVLNNLTTAIVMASLTSKILSERNDRLLFAGMIVIAANSGGVWSPIGDVTTTMLWLGNQITPLGIVKKLLLPSIVCILIPLLIVSRRLKGNVIPMKTSFTSKVSVSERNIIFYTGVISLLFVPIFKAITHLPPFMGMLFSLGILWAISEYIHIKKPAEEKSSISILKALERIDMPSILFFLGILLAVGALQSFGTLNDLAGFMNNAIGNNTIIITLIGLLSAIVDNVPLVAAMQGMYSLDQYPTDHFFWEYLAYCAGTGGSILIIGSAAGVAIMGIEKVPFFWYVKRISVLALLGFLSGALVCVLLFRW